MSDAVTLNVSIGKASHGEPEETERTFHSLAELMEYIKEIDEDVVIGQSNDQWFLTIYDDYLE